jgi:hypothetical protein
MMNSEANIKLHTSLIPSDDVANQLYYQLQAINFIKKYTVMCKPMRVISALIYLPLITKTLTIV